MKPAEGVRQDVPHSVIVVDDHPSMRLGLRATLASSPELCVVDEAADGPEALAVVRKHKPDVVVLDLLLPHLNGLDVMRTLLAELPELKFIAYSRREEAWFVREALAAGATGYVFKRSAPSELLRAVKRAAAGHSFVDPALGDLHHGLELQAASSNAKAVRLSEREAQILRLVATGAVAKEAARELQLSNRTFETYKARAMQKLQLRTRSDLLRFAKHSGWLEEPDVGGDG
jgi:DNA-binding NarL/FixJ family response regulator